MNNRIIIVLAIFSIVFSIGMQTSLARPDYVMNLTEVYNTGTCDTCHVKGTADGARTAYGMLFENKTKSGLNVTAALMAIGAPPEANQTVTATKTTAPSVTETPAATTAVPAATTKSPGFGILISLIGISAIAIFVKHKKL